MAAPGATAPRTILDLEDETLANIFGVLNDESPHTLAAVAQVCKRFNYALDFVRYRDLIIKWSKEKQSWVNEHGHQQFEWETPQRLRGLRHLIVHRGDIPLLGSMDEDADNDLPEDVDPASTTIDIAPFASLDSVLSNASNIQKLSWQVGYFPPHEITEALEANHPKAKLNLHRAVRLNDVVGLLRSDKALALSRCLNTFSMTASYGTVTEDHMTFAVILALAPNLKFASLVSHPPMRPSDPELNNKWRGDPKLWFPDEVENRKPNSSLRHLTLDGWCLSSEALQYWSQYVDLSALESLRLSRGSIYPSYFRNALQMLPNLKHVNLNLNPQVCDDATIEAAKDYIAACRPLSTLSLWSWRDRVPLETILKQHGQTLTKLHLHEREGTGYQAWMGRRHAMSADELRAIREACPNLKELTFDLNRPTAEIDFFDDGFDNRCFGELIKLNLDKIEIYFDSGLGWLYSFYQRHSDSDRQYYDPARDRTIRLDDDPEYPLELPGYPNYCPGDTEFSTAVPVPSDPEEFGLPADTPNALFHPPSTNPEICWLTIDIWDTIFKRRTTGPRELSLKFGEWERHVRSIMPGLQGSNQRDVRVWCRAKPQERDDKSNRCVVEIDCCGGHHKRKFNSGKNRT